MPPSHYYEFCLWTNTNLHLLRITQHRIDWNYCLLLRCHFRISSQANTNVLKCSKHSYWPSESKSIRIMSYCFVERRINSCQFQLVPISSLYTRIDSLYIRTGIRCLSAATQYVAIRCTTIALSVKEAPVILHIDMVTTWCDDLKILSTLLALCEGNPPIISAFTS